MITLSVNGKPVSIEAENRTLLAELLREHLNLTGTHIGCDTSQCGACVVHVNGKSVKSCSMLAVQAEGCEVTTIEGIAQAGDDLHPLQQAFHQHHALQCGFCTPGMIMSALDLINTHPDPSKKDICHWLEGNLCRCTGYAGIVDAIQDAAKAMRE